MISRPITLSELSRFLDGTARVVSSFKSRLEPASRRSPLITYAVRPYPSAGGGYELELYLAVNKCEGLAHGFYHYDAGAHALVPIGVAANELEALLSERKIRDGRIRRAADFAYDCRSLRPHFLEVQLDCIRAHPQGRQAY